MKGNELGENMFVGRKTELATLEELYYQETYQMIVMYGRRRVGKTTLISKFVENKPTVFFSAQEANDTMNLQIFSKVVYEFFKVEQVLPPFINWNDAFDYIALKAMTERFILVMDEFPYAAVENKGLRSIIQNIIDHKLKKSNIFLILCGSQISFMENEVLGYKSPLFGRRTAQMNIKGFNYIDTSEMIKSYSNEDKIKLYACIGGTPHYLAQIDEKKNVEENLLQLYFRPAGYLYDEPTMLLKQELREPAMYNSIIAAIAGGASRLNEISTKIGSDRVKTIKYIDVLLKLNILTKEYPFGDDSLKSRKGIYKIADNCYRFWYRFVFPEKTVIEQGNGKIALKTAIQDMNHYTGKTFEEISMQYMIYLNNTDKLPFTFTRSGKWWGTNPVTRTQDDVDLIFSTSDDSNVLFVECKWRNEATDVSDLNKLLNKSTLFNNYKTKYFYMFSKTGFTTKCIEQANKQGNVYLINLDNMFKF